MPPAAAGRPDARRRQLVRHPWTAAVAHTAPHDPTRRRGAEIAAPVLRYSAPWRRILWFRTVRIALSSPCCVFAPRATPDRRLRRSSSRSRRRAPTAYVFSACFFRRGQHDYNGGGGTLRAAACCDRQAAVVACHRLRLRRRGLQHRLPDDRPL